MLVLRLINRHQRAITDEVGMDVNYELFCQRSSRSRLAFLNRNYFFIKISRSVPISLWR